MRRRVIVYASAQLLAQMLFPDSPGVYHRTDRGLPHGATCVGSGYDFERDQVWFVFEHESFAEVAPGEIPPPFGVEFSAVMVPHPVDPAFVAVLNGLVGDQIRHQSQWHAAGGADEPIVVTP